MPIQFRCVYCHQLLGIARRKAGALVRCPSCDRQVVVPRPEGSSGPKSSADVPLSDPILEKSDFSAILQPPKPSVSEAAASVHRSPAVATEAGKNDFGLDLVDVEPVPLSPMLRTGSARPANVGAVRSGLYLSPTKVTLATVALLVVIALAFGGGLLVGRLLWGTT